MDSIKKIISESSFERKTSRAGNYVSKMFESMPHRLPIEPDETPWTRAEKGDTLRFRAKFSDRERLKDFISSVQELEDRMQHYVKIQIEGNEVLIEDKLSVISMNGMARSFFEFLNSIKESIDG